MSTVNKQAAESVIKGLYKEDGFDSIIIYGTMFGNIAFKLCKGQNNLETNKKTFMKNGWPYAIGWTESINGYGPQALKEFQEELDLFCERNSATHLLTDI